MRRLRFCAAPLFVVLAAAACSNVGSSTGPGAPDGSTPPSPPPTPPSGPLAGPFTPKTVAALEKLLADNGIATVAKEQSSTPLVAVTAPNGMAYTLAQVQSMALGAADGGGILGSTLDAIAPMPAGDPAFSALLAAWVTKGGTSGSKAMLELMGTRDWSQPGAVVFPVAVLPLFVADIIAAQPPAGGMKGMKIEPHELGGSFVPDCSTASNFIQDVINKVLSGLQLEESTGTGPVAGVGNIVKTIWNGAIEIVKAGLGTAITVVTAPIMSGVRTAAATAFVISQIVSDLTPWSVAVTAMPSAVNAGEGGTATGKVDTALGMAAFPTAIQSCAMALKVPLPALGAAMAPGTWSSTSPLSLSGATSVKLDSAGASTVAFTTPKPTGTTGSGCGMGNSTVEQGTVSLAVKRPGVSSLNDLVDTLIENGFGLASSLIKPAVQAILKPIVARVNKELDGLLSVSGTAWVAVTSMTGGSGTCPTTPCIYGRWTTTGTTASNGAVSGGAGVTWTFGSNDNINVQYSGSQPLVIAGQSNTYMGSENWTATLGKNPPDNGTYTAIPLAGDVTVTYVDPVTMKMVTEPDPATTRHTTTYTCNGNDLTLASTVSGITVTTTLKR